MTSKTNIAATQKRGAAVIWLVYSFFLFLNPLFQPSRRLWTITLAAFAVFLCVFTTYIRANSLRLRGAMVAATFLLGMVTFPFNGGASTFFVYAAGFLPFIIERARTVVALMVAEAAAICAETLLLHLHWPNTWIALTLIVAIGGSNIFFAAQRRAECALRDAQEENIALAAVAERERIARDLHDVLGHTLSVIVLKAELAGRVLATEEAASAQSARARKEIGDVETIARTALAEVREAIGGYRSRGLRAELAEARETLAAAGVTLVCDEPPAALPQLSAREETTLSLALREAVTNIIRHARATTCTVRFTVREGVHELAVSDNGSGCDSLQEGNGLRGMRERVEQAGGRLALTQGKGTHLRITLPLRAETAS
jgi:two-component system sensor histidine kinase DesK